MTEPDALLNVAGVEKVYASPGGGDMRVLKGVDLAVQAGEAVAIVGPSGSGKSTLLNIMGTLDRATHGTVHIDGRDSSGMNEEELAGLRARRIGFVFQMHHLLPQCSVLENVLVPTVPAGTEGGAQDRAISLLERVGLGERLGHRPGQLSGGECQRVAVVRALINEPALLLADEPTGSLDREGAEGLATVLRDLNRDAKTALVVVTHSEALANHMDRTLVVRDGVLERG
jgi:ABC-type lipoprotein export system ATPase subunit